MHVLSTREERAGRVRIPRWWPRSAVLAVVVASLLAVPLHAQEDPGARALWEIGAVGGVMDDRPEFTAGEGDPRLAHEGLVGGRLAVHLPSRFFLESEVLYAPMELVTEGAGGGTRIEQLKALLILGGAGYMIPTGSIVDFHVRSGLGGVRWHADSASEVDFIFNAGAGLRIEIAPTLGLRGDVRWHLAPSALATTRREVTPVSDARGEPLWLAEVSAGLSIYLGR